jgi:sugar phosphate isomerase/epimerase
MADIELGYGMPTGTDHETAIERAGDFGFDFVEIIMHGEMDHEGLVERADELSELLDANDLGLVVHLPMQFDLGSPFESIRSSNVTAVLNAIDAASTAGARKGVLHPVSEASGSWDDERVQTRIVESAAEVDERTSDREFEACVENIFGRQFTLANFDRLLTATDLSMTLDTGHCRLSGHDEEEVATFAREHGDRISHVHLNDNRADVSDTGDEHIPFGAGTIDFETLLTPLLDGDWSGTMCFEILGFNPDYYRTSKEQFEQLR